MKWHNKEGKNLRLVLCLKRKQSLRQIHSYKLWTVGIRMRKYHGSPSKNAVQFRSCSHPIRKTNSWRCCLVSRAHRMYIDSKTYEEVITFQVLHKEGKWCLPFHLIRLPKSAIAVGRNSFSQVLFTRTASTNMKQFDKVGWIELSGHKTAYLHRVTFINNFVHLSFAFNTTLHKYQTQSHYWEKLS